MAQDCQITNASHFPVSFLVDHRNLLNTGFSVDLDRVKGLPGFPANEYVEFQVTFNTQVVQPTLGQVDVFVPIKVRSLILSKESWSRGGLFGLWPNMSPASTYAKSFIKLPLGEADAGSLKLTN